VCEPFRLLSHITGNDENAPLVKALLEKEPTSMQRKKAAKRCASSYDRTTTMSPGLRLRLSSRATEHARERRDHHDVLDQRR